MSPQRRHRFGPRIPRPGRALRLAGVTTPGSPRVRIEWRSGARAWLWLASGRPRTAPPGIRLGAAWQAFRVALGFPSARAVADYLGVHPVTARRWEMHGGHGPRRIAWLALQRVQEQQAAAFPARQGLLAGVPLR